jgi:GT2 family glycosyltransferase
MNIQAVCLSILIPTKDRVQILSQLLKSLSALDEIDIIRPEIIVADNGSQDDTLEYVGALARDFPTALKVVKILRGGKSAAINEAVKMTTGSVLAFLDDDVVVDKGWLKAVREFLQIGSFQVGQGTIKLQSLASDDPEILRLVQLYRTVPRLEYDADVSTLHSLNGANFFMSRELFDRVGGFDERLGTGASGTSEDVDLAWRVIRAGASIGYAPQAVVYHRIDRSRLNENYFAQSHRRQGASRFLIREHSRAEIYFNLARVITQYGIFTLLGRERKRYRSKGRIYHYLGMIEARRKVSKSLNDKNELEARSPSLIE